MCVSNSAIPFPRSLGASLMMLCYGATANNVDFQLILKHECCDCINSCLQVLLGFNFFFPEPSPWTAFWKLINQVSHCSTVFLLYFVCLHQVLCMDVYWLRALYLQVKAETYMCLLGKTEMERLTRRLSFEWQGVVFTNSYGGTFFPWTFVM